MLLACFMDLESGRSSSQLRLRSGGADVARAFKLHRVIERMDGDVHVSRPTVIGARAQPVAGYLLEPTDHRAGSGPRHVAGRLLPGHAAVLSSMLEMVVALGGRGRGGRARRNDDGRFRVALGHADVDAILVVPIIAGERGQRARKKIARPLVAFCLLATATAGSHRNACLPFEPFARRAGRTDTSGSVAGLWPRPSSLASTER